MTGWRIVTDPEHGLTLHVPTVTPAGAAVGVRVDRDAVDHRIHAQTADGSEVYVEIVSFAGIVDRDEASAEQRAALRARSPEARISELFPITIIGRTATTFDFSGVLGGLRRDRRFIFVDSADRTVRIVVDPTSPTNMAILDTLELA